MIVRISGLGQYELDDKGVHELDRLDTELTDALEKRDESQFHQTLRDLIAFIQTKGKPVPDDQVVPSEVIVPPDDVTMEEAARFFTDDGLMAPLPA